MASEKGLPSKIRGLPARLVTSRLSLVDGLEALTNYAHSMSACHAIGINHRALTNDICEAYCAAIRQRHGYKPDKGQLEGGLRNASVAASIANKSLASRGFSITRRDKMTWAMGQRGRPSDP